MLVIGIAICNDLLALTVNSIPDSTLNTANRAVFRTGNVVDKNAITIVVPPRLLNQRTAPVLAGAGRIRGRLSAAPVDLHIARLAVDMLRQITGELGFIGQRGVLVGDAGVAAALCLAGFRGLAGALRGGVLGRFPGLLGLLKGALGGSSSLEPSEGSGWVTSSSAGGRVFSSLPGS